MGEDAVAEIATITTLERLNLTLFDDAGLKEQNLRLIARLPRLRRLSLPRGDVLTDGGLKELAAAPALEELSVSLNPKVTDDGFKQLSRIRTLRTLRLFQADQMGDASLKAFALMPGIEELVIVGGKHVTEEGMRAFIDGRAEKLTSLNCLPHACSDELVMHIAKKAPNLRSLNLYQCKTVTDKSIPALAGFRTLRRLEIRSTSISQKSAAELKERLTDCAVNGP
jgi:hypothetical protein